MLDSKIRHGYNNSIVTVMIFEKNMTIRFQTDAIVNSAAVVTAEKSHWISLTAHCAYLSLGNVGNGAFWSTVCRVGCSCSYDVVPCVVD